MGLESARAKDVFLAAVEISSPDERAIDLDRACAGHDELRRRVGALITAHERPESVLDHAKILDFGQFGAPTPGEDFATFTVAPSLSVPLAAESTMLVKSQKRARRCPKTVKVLR